MSMTPNKLKASEFSLEEKVVPVNRVTKVVKGGVTSALQLSSS